MNISDPFNVSSCANTLYWVKYYDDGSAKLKWDYEIKTYMENNNLHKKHEHVYKLVEQAKPHHCGCGNPWDHMTNVEYDYINSKRIPDGTIPVVVNKGFARMTFDNDKTYEQVFDDLKEMIVGDCWSVYTRTSEHKPVKVFFDSRKYEQETGLYPSQFKKEHTDKRNFISDDKNLRTVMHEAYYNNLTICVVMGCYNFFEKYYYPNQYRQSFDVIKNYYMR
jgi:hypothetical protein